MFNYIPTFFVNQRCLIFCLPSSLIFPFSYLTLFTYLIFFLLSPHFLFFYFFFLFFLSHLLPIFTSSLIFSPFITLSPHFSCLIITSVSFLSNSDALPHFKPSLLHFYTSFCLFIYLLIFFFHLILSFFFLSPHFLIFLIITSSHHYPSFLSSFDDRLDNSLRSSQSLRASNAVSFIDLTVC